MITLFMEFWTAFWSWATGRVSADNPFNVWDILWRDGGEWYARPAGQHREGMPTSGILARLAKERKEAEEARKAERLTLRMDKLPEWGAFA